MEIERNFGFDDYTALETFNTENAVDLALENRIGYDLDTGDCYIMKGSNGIVDVTGEDLRKYLDSIFGNLQIQSINLKDIFNMPYEKYFYFSLYDNKDTIGDWRMIANVSGFSFEICTVGNSTKGGGTWINRQTITPLP